MFHLKASTKKIGICITGSLLFSNFVTAHGTSCKNEFLSTTITNHDPKLFGQKNQLMKYKEKNKGTQKQFCKWNKKDLFVAKKYHYISNQ